VHPYKYQIEACEQLIYFCVKNKKKESTQSMSVIKSSEPSEAEKKLSE
jgi:hypothetical protein